MAAFKIIPQQRLLQLAACRSKTDVVTYLLANLRSQGYEAARLQCQLTAFVGSSPSLSSSSSSSLKFLEWPKQQRHHEDHYRQSKYEQNQTVL